MRRTATGIECNATELSSLPTRVGRDSNGFCANGRRAAKTLRCGEHAPKPLSQEADNLPSVQPALIEAPRSSTSILAEKAHERVASIPKVLRPLAKARSGFAKAFAAVLHEHWLRGDEALSVAAIARGLEVDEKTVRQWKADTLEPSDEPGRGVTGKPMPAAALVLLPSQLYGETVDYIAAARGRVPKRGVIKLREALSDLRSQIPHEDKAEVTTALLDAQGQIAALLRVVLEGGK